jgi:Sulfotransferase family
LDRTVAFILSTNYAGSHYASLMLGSHSKAAHVGELHHLRKVNNVRAICARCGSYSACPLFKDIRPEAIDEAFDVLFRALPDTPLIVDNSKKCEWAGRFLERPGYRKKVIHLIRDPRALVRRWDLAYRTPSQVWKQRWRWMRREPDLALALLTASRRRLYLYKWLAQNRRITRFIQAHRVDHLLVTYRDLALDTEAQLTRIMEWLGLEFERGQIEYWNVDHHGSQKTEYEWVKSEKRRFFDTRWKEHLTPEEQEAFVADRRVAGYLADLGLRVVGDGLTVGR